MFLNLKIIKLSFELCYIRVTSYTKHIVKIVKCLFFIAGLIVHTWYSSCRGNSYPKVITLYSRCRIHALTWIYTLILHGAIHVISYLLLNTHSVSSHRLLLTYRVVSASHVHSITRLRLTHSSQLRRVSYILLRYLTVQSTHHCIVVSSSHHVHLIWLI